MDYSPPGSSLHGIFQARILEWIAISFSRGSSPPRDQTHISPIDKWILSHWVTREALCGFVVVVQLLSCVRHFVTPWTTTCQVSLFFTISWSLLTLISIESVMPFNHLILCNSLLLSSIQKTQHQGLFQWVASSHQMVKVLELQLQHQSFQWIFGVDLL